ncbi:MAG: methyltransferase domain-containing protein [candidate division Zixibacteria bacterium]|nr:methyltransferase domain-containing protein [candidate division Zixibacteria bacterium]
MAEWWRDFFDENYLKVYRRRDTKTTDQEVAFARRILRLRKGQRALDVCCGYGRHAVRLACSGIQMTGIDQSAVLLHRAKRAARRQGVTIEWIEGDVRAMEFEPVFDAAYNVFTSIGYFDAEEDNVQVVLRSAAALKPGGRFLLDTINRDRITRNPQSQRWAPIGRGVELENSRYDWERGRLDSKRVLIMDDGSRRESVISLRLYTVAEVRAMFERAGLQITNVFGSFTATKFDPDSPRIIVVGRKPVRAQRKTKRSKARR